MDLLRPIRSFLVAGLFCLAAFGFAQSKNPVQLSYEPVWAGMGMNGTLVPVRLKLTNSGDPQIVEVKWILGDSQMSTFFDLPTGAQKERVVYLGNDWDGMRVKLRTGLREEEQNIELGMETEGWGSVGIVTDTPGLATFLKADRPNQFVGKVWEQGFLVTSVSPDNAPDRTVGYTYFDVLILGEGSERLSDQAVRAIQSAALAGTNVVIPGGAIQPLLTDPRWRDFLPVTGGGNTVANLAAPKAMLEFANQLPGPTPMVMATAKRSAATLKTGDQPTVFWQKVGRGYITFLAFDPFFPAWRQWSGRFAFFADQVNMASDDRTSEFGYDPYSQGSQPSASVFGVEMPGSGRIAFVLLVYFVLVVPVNFLVLKKMKRGELAWITAPLIALGAAGVLFAFAGRLYSAEASRYVSGIWIGSDGTDSAYFEGKQQLFFPGTGRYDLGFQGVESIQDYGWANRDMFGQTLVQNKFWDMDGVVAPQFEVNSLTFREFQFTQSIPFPEDWVSVTVQGDRLVGTIENKFSGTLDSLMIGVEGKMTPVGRLQPGESKTFEARIGEALKPGVGILVEGIVGGEGFGSSFGKLVGDDSIEIRYAVTREGGQ